MLDDLLVSVRHVKHARRPHLTRITSECWITLSTRSVDNGSTDYSMADQDSAEKQLIVIL